MNNKISNLVIIRLLRSLFFIFFLANFSLIYGQSKKSDSLFSKGVDLYKDGQYSKAIPYFEKVVELDKKEISEDSQRFYYGQDWLANCYYKLGNISKGREISPFNYQFDPVDRRLTIEVDKEADLSYIYQEKGNLKEAIYHILKCLELEQNVLGKKSLSCVGSYLRLGDLYSQNGELNDAINSYNSGLSILNDFGISNDKYSFELLRGRVFVHLANNDIQSALTEIKELEKISELEKNEHNDYHPSALVDLLYARINILNRDYEQAENHIITAFNDLLNQYDPNKEQIFSSIVDCIITLFMMSQYDTATTLLNDALDKVSDDQHKGILLSYLAECTYDIDICQESLKLLSEGKNRDKYYSTKLLLAEIYEFKGEILFAIDIYKQIRDYYAQENPESSNYRATLMALGDIYDQMGDYSKACDYYEQILNLLQDNKKNPDYMLTYLRWFPMYAKLSISSGSHEWEKDFELGNELKDMLANIRISVFLNHGIGLPTVANILLRFYIVFLQQAPMTTGIISSLNIEKVLTQLVYEYLENSNDYKTTNIAKAALAHTKYIFGKYDESINLMNEIISSCQRMDFPYDNYLHDLAYYQYDSGDKTGAYENFRIGYDFIKSQIISGYRWMTIDEREKITRTYRNNLEIMTHYAALTPEDSRYAELGYDALLFTKGLLLNSTIELTRILQENGDFNTLKLLNQWRRKNQEYLKAQEEEDYIKANTLKAQAAAIERELISSSKSFGDYTDGLTVDFKEVQDRLNEGDMALEYFSYQNDAKSRMYGAIMLTKTDAPKYIPIGLDSEWINLIDNCYTNDELFNYLFANLKPFLPNKDDGNIYFAADGLLHTIAIENLPGAESYNFRRLSSTREIALHKDYSKPISEAAIFGGVKYGVGKLAKYYTEDSATGINRESPGFLSYLPGTKREIDNIETLLSPTIKVSKFTATEATESNFKNFSSKRIGLLHLATHGFFDAPSNTNNQALFEEDAMKSSGLYFAGAQNTLWDEQTQGMKDDGILTAQEISTLDLRGLRLTILSACETGKGALGHDGVFGLQRGFKQAGAEGLMMSLWKVDDKATQILMDNFYKNLNNGQDQYTALRNAQTTVRKDYPDPKYWAAFILIDAIRNLN